MRHILFLLLLLGGALSMAACGNNEAVPYVDLQTEDSAPVAGEQLAAGKLPLRVAVAAVFSPEVTFDTYGPMLDYLARYLDRPVELLQRATYAEINELVRTGQADIGFVCGGAFVEGEREGYLSLLAAPQVDGVTTYQALIIVPADSPVQTLEDLRHRRFAFTDPLSNSGRLYVSYLLQQQGETVDSFFASTIFTYSHDNSIDAVVEGIVDGAAIDSLVYNSLVRVNPELVTRTRVIHTSPSFGIPPVVVHPGLNSNLQAAAHQALLAMGDDEAGRSALADLGVDGFVDVDRSLYDDIRMMAAAIRGWPTPRAPQDADKP